jgi:hypothetical protein
MERSDAVSDPRRAVLTDPDECPLILLAAYELGGPPNSAVGGGTARIVPLDTGIMSMPADRTMSSKEAFVMLAFAAASSRRPFVVL